MALSIHGSILSLFISWSPRASPLLQACSRDKDPQIGISNLRTLTWGCDSTGHGGDTEEVSTESQQGAQGGHKVQPRLTRLLSLQLVKTADLDPSRNYLAGYHPHGIATVGAFTNFCTDGTGFCSLFPGIRSHLMVLNLCFWAPVFRDYIIISGESSQPWVAQVDEVCWHGGGILRRAANCSVLLASECVVEKEARLKEALPTALLSDLLDRAWQDLKDSVSVLRELPAGN